MTMPTAGSKLALLLCVPQIWLRCPHVLPSVSHSCQIPVFQNTAMTVVCLCLSVHAGRQYSRTVLCLHCWSYILTPVNGIALDGYFHCWVLHVQCLPACESVYVAQGAHSTVLSARLGLLCTFAGCTTTLAVCGVATACHADSRCNCSLAAAEYGMGQTRSCHSSAWQPCTGCRENFEGFAPSYLSADMQVCLCLQNTLMGLSTMASVALAPQCDVCSQYDSVWCTCAPCYMCICTLSGCM